jgi:hybrid cluster-associated redox disulfide protein
VTQPTKDPRKEGDSQVDTITKDMAIGEVVQKYPQTIEVFLKHGLMCFGCAIARFENVEQGAMAHGIQVEALMKDLNAALAPASN